MILGFSHLTLNTNRTENALQGLKERGFVVKSSYKSVPSSPAKWPLMERRARQHDLFLISGGVALEIVNHDSGSVLCPTFVGLSADASHIIISIRDAERERLFLTRGLPCVVRDETIQIEGVFPAWNVKLCLIEDPAAPISQPLDAEGFSCIAVYSNNVEQDADRLISLGAREPTHKFQVTLGEKRMDILMLRSPNGAIIELIKVNRL